MPYLLRGVLLVIFCLAGLDFAHTEPPDQYVVHMGDGAVGSVQRQVVQGLRFDAP